jgi:hypothetical protein
MKSAVLTGVAILLAAVLIGTGDVGAGKDPKFTIKQVMKEAHKEGLLKKVAAGKGDKADAEKLLELYIALAANKPPMGDAESWKKFTDGMVAAAKVAVKGGDDAGKLLKKAVNCGACHKAHKG